MKFPREVLGASRDGLMLWFNNVLPALLPFIIVVNILGAMGIIETMSKFLKPFMHFVFRLPGEGGFAFVTGIISGYPMGAKAVADLWHKGKITTKEAQRLLAFCNNAGPLFIVGVVGVGLLNNSTAGYVLWAGHIISAVTMGVVTRSRDIVIATQMKNSLIQTKSKKSGISHYGKVLGEAVKNAMEALLLVGGLIIFFSVIVRVMLIVLGDIPFPGFFAGIIEVTGGVKLLADTVSGSISPFMIAVIGGIIGFGGFSVHAQALHFNANTGIKAGLYILHKILGGVITAVVTWILWHLYLILIPN